MVVEMKGRQSASRVDNVLNERCSMVVEVVRGKEYARVTVPGVLLQESDNDFVAGVYHGRYCYFEQVYSLLDKDGNEVHSFTLAELAHLREVKTRDLTSADVIQLIKETVHETETTSPGWQAGFIFGYVIACSDEFYGLACNSCGKHRGECLCHESPPSTFQQWLDKQRAFEQDDEDYSDQ
ncbi:MAG: hypothetical protein JO031_05775 [Ktedonobacteraceae bacterium]|nr:hypothetical protein [Ktedonobacteraceae bacterium]